MSDWLSERMEQSKQAKAAGDEEARLAAQRAREERQARETRDAAAQAEHTAKWQELSGTLAKIRSAINADPALGVRCTVQGYPNPSPYLGREGLTLTNREIPMGATLFFSCDRTGIFKVDSDRFRQFEHPIGDVTPEKLGNYVFECLDMFNRGDRPLILE